MSKIVEHVFKPNGCEKDCFTIEEQKGTNKNHEYYLKSYQLAKKVETGDKENGRIFGVSRKCYEAIRALNKKPIPFYDDKGDIMIRVKHPLEFTFDFPVEFLNNSKVKIVKMA